MVERGPPPPPTPSPSRVVHHGDGLAWLRATALASDHAIVTSLPDSSEVPRLGFDGWRSWFIDTAELVCRSVADDAVAIFFQTDVKREGRWVDKGFLVALGAERASSHLLWHKVVCRAPVGTTTFGRPAYAHLMCFSRGLLLAPAQSSADVIPELGAMPWARAMGTRACLEACRFLLKHTACRKVVDPFCGMGTLLAVANHLGLDAIGVELSQKRARRALALALDPTTLDS
ncbi:MAG TPA: DNA methyltransferase [Polyangiaceae bacterium]|nr:DNA methyltransferase [Polyangiaceae bacterium]